MILKKLANLYREVHRDFKPTKFLVIETNDNFLLGVYDYHEHPYWRKLAEGKDFERKELNAIKPLLKKIDTFVDVGAHIGYYSLLAHKENPKLKIFAFEPSAENYRCLLKNSLVNRANIVCFNMGLGKERTTKTLYYSDSGSSTNKFAFRVAPKKTEKIKIDKLDNHLVDGRVGIKIDVEGLEYEVLEGATKFLKNKPVFILIEITKDWPGGENKNFDLTFELLEGFGYRYKMVGSNYLFTKK